MYNATGEPPLEMNGTADAASSFELPLSLDAALPYLNPWNLSVVHWLVGFVLIRGAIAFYDNLVEFLIRFSKVPKLPTREDAATGEPLFDSRHVHATARRQVESGAGPL